MPRAVSPAVQEAEGMGMAWAMLALVVVGGLLFLRAVTAHQWALFGLMVVVLAIAAIWGTKGSIPRGDSHY
ncbi:MAG TPA: hypothetical protein VGL23_09145 [Chloroflexota bacterium]